MIEFKTSKGEFVMVDGTYGVSTSRCGFNFKDEKGSLHITLGSYKLICKLSEATEEQAKEVVSSLVKDNLGVKSYVFTLHSLVQSQGIDINKGNLYLFKKV